MDAELKVPRVLHWSAYVLVFGRRDHGSLHTTRKPAAEKRQGTKSREIGHRLSRERYEDLMRALSLMVEVTLTGFDLFVCRYGRSAGWRRSFGKCLERIDARSAQ